MPDGVTAAAAVVARQTLRTVGMVARVRLVPRLATAPERLVRCSCRRRSRGTTEVDRSGGAGRRSMPIVGSDSVHPWRCHQPIAWRAMDNSRLTVSASISSARAVASSASTSGRAGSSIAVRRKTGGFTPRRAGPVGAEVPLDRCGVRRGRGGQGHHLGAAAGARPRSRVRSLVRSSRPSRPSSAAAVDPLFTAAPSWRVTRRAGSPISEPRS